MSDIRNHFRNIAALIKAKSAVAGEIKHSSTTGRLREMIVQEFLIPHLPKHFNILSGVIIDSTGIRSSQQDCIIVDSSFPLIDVGSNQDAIVIAESVIATLEIKSYLDKEACLDSLKKIAEIKALKRMGELQYNKGGIEICLKHTEGLLPPILSYIFAYEGACLETLIEHVKDFACGKIDVTRYEGHQIVDAICVLNKGVLLRSPMMPIISGQNVTLPSLKELQMNGKLYEKDALLAFYQRLHSDLVYLRVKNYDLDEYYAKCELE